MKGDFTSASTFPVKLLHNPVIQNGRIVPYHITMTPTNVCNKNCPECFCYKRDKTKELPFSEIEKIVDELHKLGTGAISLSGGGEPDCHPKINEIISYIRCKGMDVALVTNGKYLHKVQDNILNLLDWIRVSGTSSNPVDLKRLKQNMLRAPNPGWGLSYVLSKHEPKDYSNLHKAIEFTEENPVTHLRVVSDMMHPDENRIPKFRDIIDKVVFQERTTNVLGDKECLVPLLHPIVDTDGNIQPCCGMHFATDPPQYDFGKETAICNWKDYWEYSAHQKKYDGTKCKICQYDSYNKTLKMLLEVPKNRRFV